MITQIFDLHIHSKYSRACSKNLELETIASTCEMRGINIVATGDFTHPAWFLSIQTKLIESGDGIYKLKDGSSKTKFIIGTEVASIKKHKDKTRRVHLLIFSPSIEASYKLNKKLDADGFNLKSDGRPILGMTCKDLLEYILDIDERMIMIPAHAWTPWFGIFGSNGGYDSLTDAFDNLANNIFAIETGLSSDPLMNWRCSWLDNIALISNSDAHSLQKLGREANVFKFKDEADVSYDELFRIIRDQDRLKFLNTLEFYPEEGKYHHDGHSTCAFSCEPEQTTRLKGICPKCKKPLVVGVLNRVLQLADRTIEEAKQVNRISYKSIVPLVEILGDVFRVGPMTKTVMSVYNNLIKLLGSEFYILIEAPLEEIEKASSKEIAYAIGKVRRGEVYLSPGYDGEFGTVKVFGNNDERRFEVQSTIGF